MLKALFFNKQDKSERGRLDETLRKVSSTKRIFTDTIDELNDANIHLASIKEDSDSKVNHHQAVSQEAQTEIENNNKLISKIQEILE